MDEIVRGFNPPRDERAPTPAQLEQYADALTSMAAYINDGIARCSLRIAAAETFNTASRLQRLRGLQ